MASRTLNRTAGPVEISRRSLLGGGLSLTALASLAACHGSSGAGASSGLTFPFLTDTPNHAYANLTALYNKTAGKKVKLQEVPGDWQNLLTRINSQRQAGKAPDLTLMTATLIPTMTSRSQILDLAPLAKDYDRSLMSKAAIDTYVDGDHLWAFPGTQYTQVMVYNKTLLEKAGIAEPSASYDKPWTFDQWRDAAEATATKDGKVYGAVVDVQPERTIQYLWSNGASYFSDDLKKYTMDSDQAIEVYEFLGKFFTDKLAPPQSVIKQTPGEQLFVAGRVATTLIGSFSMPTIAKSKGFEWGIAPAPVGSTGKSYTPIYVDGWVIPKGAKSPSKSWAAIDFFSNDKSWDLLAGLNVGGIPPLLSSAAKNRKALFPGLTEARKQVWFDSLDHTKPYGYPPNYAQILDVTLQQLALITTGDQSAEKVLKGLAKPIQSLLDQG